MNSCIYVVTEFVANGDITIYTPDVNFFVDIQEAYNYYNNIKEKIIKQDYPFHEEQYENYESIYQIAHEYKGVSIHKCSPLQI